MSRIALRHFIVVEHQHIRTSHASDRAPVCIPTLAPQTLPVWQPRRSPEGHVAAGRPDPTLQVQLVASFFLSCLFLTTIHIHPQTELVLLSSPHKESKIEERPRKKAQHPKEKATTVMIVGYAET